MEFLKNVQFRSSAVFRFPFPFDLPPGEGEVADRAENGSQKRSGENGSGAAIKNSLPTKVRRLIKQN